MASMESEVRTLLEHWCQAARTKDIDRLMSLYSHDITYFGVVPPLQFTGSPAVRGNFLRWFDGYKSSIGLEMQDVNILASGDVATAFMLLEASGTLQDGGDMRYRVRATVCCERSDRGWLIAHEHISLPVDFRSGRAVMEPHPKVAQGYRTWRM